MADPLKRLFQVTMQELLTAAGLIAALASPALADTYTVDAKSTLPISIDACRPFVLKVIGDTDLDFRLISPVGRTVFSDVDGLDITASRVNVTSCGGYTLYVQNIGSVWNRFDLRLVDAN